MNQHSTSQTGGNTSAAGQKVKLTGLWEKRTSSGDPMFTGSLSPSAKIVIFKNQFKTKDSDPDYVLYLESVVKDVSPPVEEDEIEFPNPFDLILARDDWRSLPPFNTPLSDEENYV